MAAYCLQLSPIPGSPTPASDLPGPVHTRYTYLQAGKNTLSQKTGNNLKIHLLEYKLMVSLRGFEGMQCHGGVQKTFVSESAG